MATADPHQFPSRYIFPSPASFLPRQRPTTSHYRPISQVLSNETDALEARPPRFSRRGSVNSLLEMVHKQKSKRNGGQLHQIPTRSSPIRQGSSRSGFGKAPRGAAVIAPRAVHDSNVIHPTEDVYVAKKSWHSYGRMKLHPYSNDAVYMQSYDPIMLENEKYDYLLLRHLTSSVPTFNKSMKKPPSNVLDLGCGQGHWLLDAADFWLNTDFTGFDLVDILLPEVRQKENIHLVRGNFVKYPLPFPDKSFDFVRMANLSLAIPHDKWSFVISEARRILRVGGLLEIIDDEVFFPYGPFPVRAGPSEHHRRNGQGSNRSKHSPINDGEESDASSSTLGEDDDYSLDKTSKGEGTNQSRLKSPWTAGTASRRHRMAYLQQWASNYRIARDVEDSFIGMLQQRSIHLTPQELVHQLRHTFGYKNCSSPKTYDITLAAVSMLEAEQPGETNVDSLLWSDQDLVGPLEEKERRYSSGSDGDSPTPPQHSAKAAGRLGISYSDLVAATTTTAAVRQRVASTIRSHRQLALRKSAQPPGIVVSPSTFIPLTPIETEFHACKWIHTVLGCKPAIAEYVRSDDDQIGSQVMDEAELSDALWTYESFRRQRFHWPADPEPDPESFASPSISNACKLNVHQLFEGPEPEPVHIRTIRVYHATKTDTTSLASRFFSTHTSSPLSRR